MLANGLGEPGVSCLCVWLYFHDKNRRIESCVILEQCGNVIKPLYYYLFRAIPGVVHLGSGAPAQDEYRSVVYYHEDKPRWTETFKIAIPIQEFYHSHLKFTFKHRSSNETKDRAEKPFALSYVKLMQVLLFIDFIMKEY